MEKENIMINFLLMLINIGGTIAWICISKFVGWWIFIIIVICGLTALKYAIKIIQALKRIKN